MPRCAAKDCKRCFKNDKYSMCHRFPSMEDKSLRICSSHFQFKMYCYPEKARLMSHAMPTLFNTPTLKMANNDLTRVKGTSIVKPIIYGNTAKYFGQKRHEDGHTHKWCVYVRPYVNEDIGTWVKKVHFKLHDSYESPTRVVQKPPFEVSETGWGEFELVIKIFFQDTSERPVTLYHVLKLYSNGPDSELSEKPVLSEFYEEIIFQDPSTFMKFVLNDTLSKNPSIDEKNLHYERIKKTTVEKMIKSRKRVQEHTVMYKERLKKLRETINKFKDEICALQSQCSSSTLR